MSVHFLMDIFGHDYLCTVLGHDYLCTVHPVLVHSNALYEISVFVMSLNVFLNVFVPFKDLKINYIPSIP